MALGMTVEGLYRELDDYEPRWAQDMKRRFQKLIDLYEEKLWKAYNEEEEDNEGISY
jgi:hypothetical protein